MQFKSILPDRSTKVDVSLAGPFAGAALSFSMFVVGLLLSSNPDSAGDLVQVPSMLFQGSLLLGLISRGTLGYAYVPLPVLAAFRSLQMNKDVQYPFLDSSCWR